MTDLSNQEIRSEIARLRSLLRTSGVNDVVALMREGRSRSDVATELGISYATVLNRLAKHTKENGEVFSKGPWPKSWVRDPARAEAVIAAYKSHGTLEKAAVQFGVTRERVRQIIVRHERISGVLIPRTGNALKRQPRVDAPCANCGKIRTLLPSVAVKTPYCGKCSFHFNHRRLLPDETIDQWIADRRAGESWYRIGIRAGYSIHGTHQVTSAVYRRLLFRRDETTISELWPIVPRWLKVRFC